MANTSPISVLNWIGIGFRSHLSYSGLFDILFGQLIVRVFMHTLNLVYVEFECACFDGTFILIRFSDISV